MPVDNPADGGQNVHIVGGAAGSQSAPAVGVDQGEAFISAGTIAGAGTATQPWSATTTSAWLTLNTPLTNTNPVYYSTVPTSSAGFPIWPGQGHVPARLTNPATVKVYVSSGDVCGWKIEQ